MGRLSASAIVVASVCQAATAHAAISGRDVVFTAICTDQQATAFEWKNGKWAMVPYFPNIYTVNKFARPTPGCTDVLQPKSEIESAFVDISYGCYRITPFAQAASPPIACVEVWASEALDAALNTVTCAGDTPNSWIVFDPAGNFQFSQLGNDLGDAPVGGSKDPLILSVGRCAIARQR